MRSTRAWELKNIYKQRPKQAVQVLFFLCYLKFVLRVICIYKYTCYVNVNYVSNWIESMGCMGTSMMRPNPGVQKQFDFFLYRSTLTLTHRTSSNQIPKFKGCIRMRAVPIFQATEYTLYFKSVVLIVFCLLVSLLLIMKQCYFNICPNSFTHELFLTLIKIQDKIIIWD